MGDWNPAGSDQVDHFKKVSLRLGEKTRKRSRSRVTSACLNFVGEGTQSQTISYHVHGHRDDCGWDGLDELVENPKGQVAVGWLENRSLETSSSMRGGNAASGSPPQGKSYSESLLCEIQIWRNIMVMRWWPDRRGWTTSKGNPLDQGLVSTVLWQTLCRAHEYGRKADQCCGSACKERDKQSEEKI